MHAHPSDPLSPPTEALKLARAEADGDAARFLRALEDGSWADGATTVKAGSSSAVYRVTLEDRAFCMKVARLSGPKRALQSLTRSTRGHRAWDGTDRLARAGCDTATPRALVTGTSVGTATEALFTDWLDGQTVLDALRGDLPNQELPTLARHTGAAISRMVTRGLYNRDHKPSNLIVLGTDRPPAVIDTVAIRRFRLLDRAALTQHAAHMLACLAIEPTGVGAPEADIRLLRVASAACAEELQVASARQLFRASVKRVINHGDPRPKDPPSPPEPAASPAGASDA
ncbi:MAG: hypothetical protein AAGG07_06865 [Planctomycetota bacterium]